MIIYVLGLIFSHDREDVLLIRKNRPVEQEGLLNGIRGKKKETESLFTAIDRECTEETGLSNLWWECCGYFQKDEKYIVYLFVTDGEIYGVDHETDEGKLEIHNVQEIQIRNDVMPNLKWLIPMALAPDKPFIKALENGRKRTT